MLKLLPQHFFYGICRNPIPSGIKCFVWNDNSRRVIRFCWSFMFSSLSLYALLLSKLLAWLNVLSRNYFRLSLDLLHFLTPRIASRFVSNLCFRLVTWFNSRFIYCIGFCTHWCFLSLSVDFSLCILMYFLLCYLFSLSLGYFVFLFLALILTTIHLYASHLALLYSVCFSLNFNICFKFASFLL